MRRLFRWLKVADSKHVRDLAYNSAKAYYKGKQFTSVEFQAYQRGFINSYTTAYIKANREANRV